MVWILSYLTLEVKKKFYRCKAKKILVFSCRTGLAAKEYRRILLTMVFCPVLADGVLLGVCASGGLLFLSVPDGHRQVFGLRRVTFLAKEK